MIRQFPFCRDRCYIIKTAAVVSRRRFCFGTFCPEVSAGDKIPQGELDPVQLVHQPRSDSRNAEGRSEERKDEEHDPAHRLPADEQDQGEQRQHDAAQLAHGGRRAEQKCDHSGQQGTGHHHGAAGILGTIIAAASIKNRVGLSFYSYYAAGKIGTQGCR